MYMKNPLVTFIIPAYNAMPYIEECLHSLRYQTRMNHQVIVVNDGSTDESGIVAKKYAENYPEIFAYYEQQNQGQGAARNFALSLVDTPYVTFLDSDDWQDCHFVERLEAELSKHDENVDIVFTLPWVYDSVTHEKLPWRDKQVIDELFYPQGGYEDVPSAVITQSSLHWLRLYEMEVSPCRRVFRTQFLRDINYRFVTGRKWEDVWPHFLSIHHAERCIALRSSGFVYRINNSAQTTSGGGATRKDVAPVFDEILEIAMRENWRAQEIAHIIRTFRAFTDWTIQVTNLDYMDEVMTSLHAVYKKIPKHYIKVYRNTFHMGGKDTFLLVLLRSPMYGLLKDYRIRKAGIKVLSKIKQLMTKFRR